MLRTSHHVKYRQCLLPVLCRFLSIQSVNLNKAPTISSDPDVRIVSRSSLKKKKSKRRKEPVAPSIPLSQRLRDASIKREIAAGDWNALPNDVSYNRVPPPTHVDVATLAHGLEKVLLNPGVHFLRDPKTKAYNFTPYLEDITQPLDFDYDSLQPYITSSKDTSLGDLAQKLEKQYIGSTSSVSAMLSHLYFVMSNFKPVNTSCLSRAFENESQKFTKGARTPASVYLRWKNGVYAVDVDKSYDLDETILSVLGKSLEKMLTSEPDEFEKHLKENSSQLTKEEKNRPESYAYGEIGKFLLRSQLDCFDPKLPRGTFDLKTRAVMPVRLDIQNYAEYLGYKLKRSKGLYESFEREYYDMIRSAFLKYSFQVRIGHMDGIMVAYHNTSKIFGFQYISREEMDSRLFGSTKIGDQVFRNALVMFESILDRATEKYPRQTLRLSFDTKQHNQTKEATTYIFVEAVPDTAAATNTEAAQVASLLEPTNTAENDYDPYDNLTMYSLKTQSLVNNRAVQGPLEFKNPQRDTWTVHTKMEEMYHDDMKKKHERFVQMRRLQASVYLPSNKKNPLRAMFKRISEKVETIPMIPLSQTQARGPELQKKVSFWNGLGLVVGLMIGSGLFSSPGPVLESSGAYGTALVVWLISGLLAMCGALCYAELGTMLPMNGGEAVYLGRAFGSLVSFMFEFVTIVIQKPGSLAIICIVFGDYVSRIAYHTYFFNVPHDSDASVELADSVIPPFLPKLLAVVCLLVLTLINAFSVRAGIRVQDVLTVVKVLTAIVISVVGVVVLTNKGLVVGNSLQGDPFQGFGSISFGQFAVAFYSGLWAYEGWNNLNYVSGEMKDPHRDLPRVIIFGIPLVIFCYMLSNVAYLAALRFEVVTHTNTVAMDFGKKIFGPAGGIIFAVCVSLSCFGSANASVFTGARIIYVSAKQGHIPSFFGKLSQSRQTPILALLLQACLTTVMIMIGSFRVLVNFYSLSAWIFYLLAVLSLLIFRYTEPGLKRPYRVWLSTPILFCMVALFLCTTPFIEAPIESAIALGIVLLAIPIWLVHVKFRPWIARGWEHITSRIKGDSRNRQGYHGMEMTEAD